MARSLSRENRSDKLPACRISVDDKLEACHYILMDAFFDWNQPVNVTERNLPHWSQKCVVYFATFRLADSIPKPTLIQWAARREVWLKAHPEPREASEQKEYRRLFTRKFHEYLDSGHGACLLADKANSRLVAEALTYFEKERYQLGDWVVMPNHVHVLFQTLDDWAPKQILHSWKSYTATRINKSVSRKGPVWQHESYDRIVRTAVEFERIRAYIRDNPRNAKAEIHHASWLR